MDTAGWYRRFAEIEAAASSPRYRLLASGVADDPVLLDHIDRLPLAKRQPNLLFASTQFLNGPTTDWVAFRTFVLDEWDRVAASMRMRSTQTNEPARCSAFLPVLASLPAPVALIEVGASAGLCLYPDRYSYAFEATIGGPAIGGSAIVGESTLRLDVACSGPTPIPVGVPDVCWRRGIDLNPLDVGDPDDVAWLRACIWPEQHERRARLDRAVDIAAADPPTILRCDLVDGIDALVASAPVDATTVVFHSAVLSYLTVEQRRAFATKMRRHADVVWLSNEAPHVVEGLGIAPPSRPNGFVLGRDGHRALAFTDPHGEWLDWLEPA